MAYNPTRTGPDPAGAFMVLEGMVAVVGIEEAVMLLPGVIWPGNARLPEELRTWLSPVTTHLMPDTQTAPWVPTPREVEFAAVFVQVQRLRSRTPLGQRIEMLRPLADPAQASQYTVAALLNVSRETVTKFSAQIYGRPPRSEAAD